MEVGKDEGIKIGSNPFYQTGNSNYGTSWQAAGGENPVKMGAIPVYSDILSTTLICNRFQGARELALQNAQRTYKHEALDVMRENGELDTDVYPEIKRQSAMIKKQEVYPKAFPVSDANKIKYPEGALKKNLLYQTTS